MGSRTDKINGHVTTLERMCENGDVTHSTSGTTQIRGRHARRSENADNLYDLQKQPAFEEEHKTLNDTEVDMIFREPFIHAGYRPPGKPWGYYLSSLFWVHNESLNVWTHLFGCCLVIIRALMFGSELDHFHDPRSWSVLGFAFSCVMNNLLSASAHLLHSKSPRHHAVLYIIDYAGITIYNLGNAVGSMYSCSGSFMYRTLEGIFLPVSVFLCWASFLVMARSRLVYHDQITFKRKVVLIIVMVGNCIFMALPMGCRYVQCFKDPSCTLSSLNHINVCFLFFALDGLCFAAHCPERWLPGRFDLLGHGHQWFHLLVMVTQQLQFHAQHVDIVQLQHTTHVSPSLKSISLSFVVLIVAEVLTLLFLTSRHIVGRDETPPEGGTSKDKQS